MPDDWLKLIAEGSLLVANQFNVAWLLSVALQIQVVPLLLQLRELKLPGLTDSIACGGVHVHVTTAGLEVPCSE